MMAVAVNLVALTSILSGLLARRLSLAAIAGGSVGLASGLGAAGKLAFSPNHPLSPRGRHSQALRVLRA
jgi:hypothetical protein